MRESLKVGVLGGGAIGGTLGIKLSSAGVPVTVVNRRPSEVTAADLVVHDIDGQTRRPNELELVTDPAALGDVDICLLAVKSKDTEAAGATLAEVLRGDALVISFQNGLRNPDRLRVSLPAERVFAGMVSYNVVRPSAGVFRQATSGPLVVRAGRGGDQERLRTLAKAFARAGDELLLRDDIVDVQAGKLLLNLNNSVCAATGVTILESLRSRTLRRAYAALMGEGLEVLRAAGMEPRLLMGLPPGAIVRMLPLPDFVVLNVARKLVAIDPEARSSTLQDLLQGRPTEIDDLSGEIVYRAERAGRTAPRNRRIVELIRGISEGGAPYRFVAPDQLLRELR